ncbi:MAG: hypothetical protein JW739_05980 [Opitutales bacterium]|nr:hypothetical protein [Opitutales bacterium]
MFESVSGYNPRQTLLIVDEAHNLPSRTAGNFEHTLAFKEVEDVCIELQLNAVNKALRDACNTLAALLRKIEKSEEIASSFLYELSDILSRIETEFSKTHLEETLFSNSARECIWEYLEALRTLQTTDIELLLWAPENKTLRISCLDAATVIKQQLNPFAQKILMSATLTPPKAFLEACDLAGEDIEFIRGSSPWRENAYSVAIDMRVDTRMKERNRYFRPTAQTAIEMRIHSLNPVVVFFPSYAYAKSIQWELEMIAPEMRVALQPKGGNLAEQEHFVSNALKFSDFLFLVLGSSFSEGIDLLGGYVDSCMVVGPALPEVNAVQQAKMHRAVESRDKAFQRIYSIPALTKINQALGRLVRHPDHKAKVLLHCKRFSRDDYHNLLDPVYQNGARITSGNELRIWLEK